MKHVEADGIALTERPVKIGSLLFCIGRGVLRSPVIEPAVPIFAIHKRSIRTQLLEGHESFLRFSGTIVDCSRQHRKRAIRNLLRAVSSIELSFRESGV